MPTGKRTPERPNLIPLPLANPALLQALLHPLRHIRRNQPPKLLQIRPLKRILPQRRRHNIIIQPEESLRRLLHARVLAREPSNEKRIVASGVKLRVHCPLREYSHLIRTELVADCMRAVLERELRG